jgi:hypothetical protein
MEKHKDEENFECCEGKDESPIIPIDDDSE